MRLQLILPTLQPDIYREPPTCPAAGCGGRHVQLRQTAPKPVRDTRVTEVVARRYGCVRCGRTFRVYPVGVSHAQTSARLKGVAVMLYVMGLSYGAVALVLTALGHTLSKSAVSYAVQAAGERVPGLRREAVRGPAVAALGADLTSVKCQGHWLRLGVSVDAVGGLALTVDVLENGETATLTAWIGEVAALVGAEVLVSDDADAFKPAADDNGLAHQVCKAHVVRNTEAWVAKMTPELARDADGSLAAIGVAPARAVADGQELLRLMQERQPTPEASATLAAIHRRYLAAQAPRPGAMTSLAYRLRLFSLDRWNLWARLTRDRGWEGPGGERLDGTNNATERAIGWWVKERYRTMRGYKRPRSVQNVSRLIAWAGNHLNGPGADLATLIP